MKNKFMFTQVAVSIANSSLLLHSIFCRLLQDDATLTSRSPAVQIACQRPELESASLRPREEA